MRLTDVMSGAGLSSYTIIAMILFMAAFVAIAVWLFLPSRKREFDRAGRLPLEDGAGSTNHQGGSR